MSDAAGSWRFANGKLSVQGGLQVADTAVPSRFNPLLSKDFALDFNGQRITALGTLIEPRSRSRIMKVDIAHDLGSGAGQADLLVQDLRFGEALQPEDLTRVARSEEHTSELQSLMRISY